MLGDERTRNELFTRRTLLLAGAQGAAFSLLAARLYQLQIIDGDDYRTLAEENRINLELLLPARGRIFDRNGIALADNGRSLSAFMVPEQTNGVPATLAKLAQLVDLNDADIRRILSDVERNRPFAPIDVTSGLDWQSFARINANSADLPGLHTREGSLRVYPTGTSSAHIVGYVGPVSEKDQANDPDPLLSLGDFRIGKRGVENRYESSLRGTSGNRQIEVNAYGRVIRELERNEGTPGQDIHLTLDQRLQAEAMGVMGTESGASIVIDVQDGGILAMASTPGFDPNAFARGISHEDWEELSSDPKKPLLNKPLRGRYPPGSTFKIAVMAAAFEAGIIDETRRIFCPGYLEHGNHRFHCWTTGGHGHVDYLQAMRGSCDVYFYNIARELGIDRISDMAQRLGLGQSYDLTSGTSHRGLLPTRAWKEATRGKQWLIGETLIAGIGQGYVLSTPLELAVMTARIANGKHALTPTLDLASTTQETTPPLKVKPWVIKHIRDSLDQAVNHPAGTAFPSRLRFRGNDMAGKTGTAQVRTISRAERQDRVLRNDEIAWAQRDHALFVGYAPVNNPRYAAAVVVEHGGSGSHAAAPKARDLLRAALRLKSGQRASSPKGHG
ncbi:MAG: penicillin-binding protein 2 [Alphaproteobacteria bacterium]